MHKKTDLINFMNLLDFHVADVEYANGVEWVAHKSIDSEELVWFDIRAEGSGFNQMFRGEIKKVCENEWKTTEKFIQPQP